MLRAVLIATCIFLTIPTGVTAKEASVDREVWLEAHRDWQQQRLERLLEADGWLTLTGLHWLSPEKSEWRIGAADDNDIVLNGGPQKLALLRRDGEVIWLQQQFATPDQPVDASVPRQWIGPDGARERLVFGPWQLELIERDGAFGLRERNAQAPTRTGFLGLEAFPPSLDFRVDASFLPYEEPQVRTIPTVAGVNDRMNSPGRLQFDLKGQSFEIEAYQFDGDDELFIVFGDRSNGNTTYGGGRFIYTPLPDEQQRTVIDFNRAYNPPCVFTPYSTCPIPPRSNRLDLIVRAGERLPPEQGAGGEG